MNIEVFDIQRLFSKKEIEKSRNDFDLFKTIESHLEPFRVISSNLEPFGAILGHLEPFGAI